MTYTYRCIGKGTTDSNGVAHITHDCSGNALSDDGYKGVGAGLMDFIASTDAPSDISDGSFQSETYPILDCIKRDNGTTSNHNDDMWDVVTNLSRGNDYTTINASGSTTFVLASLPIKDGVCFEIVVKLDVGSDSQILTVRNSSFVTLSQLTKTRLNLPTGNWVNVKCEIKNNQVIWSNDYNSNTATDSVTGVDSVVVRCGVGETFLFNNVRIYPI